MKTRSFGKTGLDIGEVGLGTWQIGANWGNVTDETALQVLRSAWESGSNFFDTADVYGMGRSEELIGRFLRETRASAAWRPRWEGSVLPDGRIISRGR
jgi:aryl-alcohol dehydrogenase-like predicted oxidoreductase